MIYVPDALIDQLLLDDIQYGDLTTRALGLQSQLGVMTFASKFGGCVSGIAIARRMLEKLGITCECHCQDGQQVEPQSILIRATGPIEALHQGWKAVQNVLEWCGGVSHYTQQMVSILHQYQPDGQLACTRKTIPQTKPLALTAILAGGAIIHRAGSAESILLFTNHRQCLEKPDDWAAHIKTLRQAAPEKMIIVEADDYEQAILAINAQADIIQLDKLPIEQIQRLQELAKQQSRPCRLSIAGGINLKTIETFAQTGVPLLVTSAPYYAAPRDIKVKIFKQ
ncbi:MULTISPECIES: ModD protein [Providencia]|uniref:Putative pyrophosphorylase ModD n=1 Tax=Providencia huaxiensis TaxID=2027290 RepID=A0ABU2ISZ0_9GAMM|nr:MULTISPECIES: ModD protein [Providencia]MBZ3683514.1 ModD protein [Providencia rettgeri]AXH63018.1 ModD protein [Providencia huaxiensis]MDT0132186.1 ModD protein [Providencia huaxiensis]MDT1978592.1 ModD protein [Providencia huaxiensis]QLR01718.1 ModD protein [Providencia rettgeri]